VLEVEKGTAVRVPPETHRSVWNEGPEDVELAIVSVKGTGSEDETELKADFWPE